MIDVQEYTLLRFDEAVKIGHVCSQVKKITP